MGLLGTGVVVAAAMQSAAFRQILTWVGGGGSRGSSAAFQNTASIGQGLAGPVISGGSFRLHGGFIQPLNVVASPNSCTNISNPLLATVCSIVGPGGVITVAIPGGALTQSTSLSVTLPGSLPIGTSPLVSFNPLGRGVDISVGSGERPKSLISIFLTYLASDPTPGREPGLKLSLYDSARGFWTPLPGVVDQAANTVTSQSNKFGLIQLMEILAANNLENALVAPNPFRPSFGNTRMVFSNLPDNVTVQIFTQSGELVRDLITDAGGQAFWDINNNNGAKVVSGSYIAVIQRGSDNRVITIAVER